MIIVVARCSRKIDHVDGFVVGSAGKRKREKRKKRKRRRGMEGIFSPAHVLKYERGDEMINRSSILARKKIKKAGGRNRIDETDTEKDTFK